MAVHTGDLDFGYGGNSGLSDLDRSSIWNKFFAESKLSTCIESPSENFLKNVDFLIGDLSVLDLMDMVGISHIEELFSCSIYHGVLIDTSDTFSSIESSLLSDSFEKSMSLSIMFCCSR